MTQSPRARAEAFCASLGIRIPVLMAPMAGACPPELASAVANAGGMGACGSLLMEPDAIAKWVEQFRAGSNGVFQLNTWIPDPEPVRNPAREAALRDFLGQWGPKVPRDAGDQPGPDFDAQCDAMLTAGPQIISSIMGLYPQAFVARMKEQGVKWFATATTVGEAVAAEEAGADVIVAQGMEAGGHRGAFDPSKAETAMIGLFSLLPAIVDAVKVPVIATGGIADGRGAAAALTLGASAVQIGTALLRSPEAGISAAWSDAIGAAKPEDTIGTRAYSGRLGRSIRTEYAVAAAAPDVPAPAPYPIQRGLTKAMKDEAAKTDDINRMQAWAGQSAGLARDEPAGDIVTRLWDDACGYLPD